jgi:hypothetical protein
MASIVHQAVKRDPIQKISFNGEDLTLREWCERTGIPLKTLKNRCRFKWPAARMLTEPHRDAPAP